MCFVEIPTKCVVRHLCRCVDNASNDHIANTRYAELNEKKVQCSNLDEDLNDDAIPEYEPPGRVSADQDQASLLSPSSLGLAGQLFGAWVHSTVITVTAILIGLFIELR